MRYGHSGGGGHGDGDHGEDAGVALDPMAEFNARGSVSLDAIGEWTATLEIADHHGSRWSAETRLAVERGGPSHDGRRRCHRPAGNQRFDPILVLVTEGQWLWRAGAR